MLLAVLAFGPARATAAGRRAPALAPANTVIDGPSPDITALSGMAVARDGTGGVVYLKTVSGGPHVFVSRLLAGRFQAPQQVDASLSGPSSQPVIAASNPGQLVIAFVNAGELYTVQSPNAGSPLSAPSGRFTGAGNPALAMSPFGKAYLAFTATAGSGADVRTAFYNQGAWTLESASLNVTPGDDAGTGTGRPEVAAAGDGVGIVVWGENGHVYSRRLWGASPSVVDQQVDVAFLSGLPEVSADQPAVASGGDSSYAAIAFRETFADGSSQQSRVLTNRLQAGQVDGISQTDGITTSGGEGADQPQVVASEYGAGFVTSEHQQSHDIYAASLGSNEHPNPPGMVNGQIESAAPDAVPATAGLYSTLIAFQQTPGSAGAPEIRVRYAPGGSDLGPEQVISSPSLGPSDAGSGLVAGGDVAGDAAIAWVQGSGAGAQIVAAQLYQPPGGFRPRSRFRYATSANPVLAWSTAAEQWGPVRYVVSLDGVPVATTTQHQIQVPATVADGSHPWQVTAVNPGGLTSSAPAATVFVDTVAPQVSISVSGPRRVGAQVRVHVRDTDAPPPLAPADASGIQSAQIDWGDGTARSIEHTARHVYPQRGTYVITVMVRDRAGNRTTVVRRVTIRPKRKRRAKLKPAKRRKKGRRR